MATNDRLHSQFVHSGSLMRHHHLDRHRKRFHHQFHPGIDSDRLLEHASSANQVALLHLSLADYLGREQSRQPFPS